MKKTILHALFVTALAGGGAATASATEVAIPPGWAKIETAGFVMALPADWREFRTKKMNVLANPHFGAWGFMSPHASKKVLVRVNKLRPGTPAEMATRARKHLARKVTQLEQIKEIPVPKDEKGRDGVVIILKGVVEAVSRKTKEVRSYPHLIVRGVIRFPAFGIQISVTHLTRADLSDDAEEFFMKQIATMHPRDPAEVKKLIEIQPNRDIPEVNEGAAAHKR